MILSLRHIQIFPANLAPGSLLYVLFSLRIDSTKVGKKADKTGLATEAQFVNHRLQHTIIITMIIIIIIVVTIMIIIINIMFVI